MNYNSVRSRLSVLTQRGILVSPFRANYIPNPTYGVGVTKPIRVQNMRCVAEKVRLSHINEIILKSLGYSFRDREGWVKIFQFVDGNNQYFRLRIQLGIKRSKVTWTVKAPQGLDYYSFRLSKQWVEDNLARLGIVFTEFDDSFEVKRSEFLVDHMAVNLDGMKSVTIRTFDGEFEKIYNKSYGIRREVVPNEPTSIGNVLALVTGGVAVSQVISGVGLTNTNILHLNETQKGTNRLIQELVSKFDTLIDSHFKLIDKVGSIEERLE